MSGVLHVVHHNCRLSPVSKGIDAVGPALIGEFDQFLEGWGWEVGRFLLVIGSFLFDRFFAVYLPVVKGM